MQKMFFNLIKFHTKLRYGYTKREERPDLKADMVTRQSGANETKQNLNTAFSYTYMHMSKLYDRYNNNILVSYYLISLIMNV